MPPEISIALLSSSNLQFFADDLRLELRKMGWQSRLWISGFNQYRQDIWNADSEFYAQAPDVVILHLEGEDLFMDALRNPFSPGVDRLLLAQTIAQQVENAVKQLHACKPDATVILNTVHFPPVHALTGLEYHSLHMISDLPQLYNAELCRISRDNPNVLVHDEASLVLRLGYGAWFDARLWYLARCRLSRTAMRALADSNAALLRAWRGQTCKCVVLDLDNTLWGGIIGEDSVEGVVLGEEGPGMAFAEFQEELLNLTRKGILLAICSKNNEEDALLMFRQHPSMRLKEEHFAARRINWQDKVQNLRELAEQLNLGLDSLIFIDDNPAERGSVRNGLPEVIVPDWPEDPSHYKAALLALARQYLMKTSLTSEDQARTLMYRSESERKSLLAAGGNIEDFYRALEMKATIGLADSFSLPRIAQLTQKTNQFNLTTRRYSEADIRAFSDDPRRMVLRISVADRFADNGLVGVLIFKECSPCVWEIDTFLLSCRVIGRKVENAFLAYACQRLAERGAAELIGVYSPTKKNTVCARVYQDLGFERIEEDDSRGIMRWRLSLQGAAILIPDWIVIESTSEMAHHG
jgi:FkbH-like protein